MPHSILFHNFEYNPKKKIIFTCLKNPDVSGERRM